VDLGLTGKRAAVAAANAREAAQAQP